MNTNEDRQRRPGHIDLLRHGRTKNDDIFRGATDDPLSEHGHRQMSSAVEGGQWDRIVTSPLSRCAQFASEHAERSDTRLRTDERLREYGFGDWDGRKYDEVMAREHGLVSRFFADPWRHPPPNGEPFADFRGRVLQAWYQLIAEAPSQKTLVISHGGVIMTIIADVLGVDRLHGKVEIGYSSITRIRLDDGGNRPRLVFQHHFDRAPE